MDLALKQAQARRDQFVELLSAHRCWLYGYLIALVQNTADAEDLFQNVSLILWEKFDEFQPQRGSFMSWACGTAQFEVRNFWRRQARHSVRFTGTMIRANLELIMCSSHKSNMSLIKDSLPDA